MRPGLLVATWALTALVATGVALGSVRLVGEQVAGRPPVLTPEAVAALAASAAPVPGPAAAAPPTPSAPDPVPVAPPEPAAPQGPGPAPAPGGAAAPVGSGPAAEPPGGTGARPPVAGRGPSTALPAPRDAVRSQPVAPPPPVPAAPAAPAGPPPADPPPAPSVRTVTAVGGTLAVACEGTRPALVYATPTAGFASEVRDSGDSLQVRFRGQEDESRVRVVCAGGSPSVEVDERD